jgi:Mn2+/Fe2+ NRAMP family transporter
MSSHSEAPASATRSRSWTESLGPGLLWAGTAVGVSHLVQSTRAGAGYGFALVWLVVLANVLKYPAFEAAPRYTAATGRSLLQAYRAQGRWAIPVFLALTFTTMWVVLAAVTFVTAGMASQLLSDALGTTAWSAILLAGSALLLASGQWQPLERLMTALMLVLTVSTLACVALLFGAADLAAIPWTPLIPPWTAEHIGFLVALVGWMPTAIDMAVWQSLWGLEKARSEGRPLDVHGSRVDFWIGYIGTAVLAVCFVTIGAAILYGTGRTIPNESGAFAALFVDMYAAALGEWSRPLVLVAAFATMLSTTITVLDGFPRALEVGFARLRADEAELAAPGRAYFGWMAALAAGALVLISAFTANLKGMVDLATTMSFLTAPLLAWMNLRAVTAPEMPAAQRPGPWLYAGHVAGIVFMGAFAGYYAWLRLAGG